MSLDSFSEVLVLTFAIWCGGLAILFAMVWQTSRVTMRGRSRTPISRAQHIVAAGLAVTFLALCPAFLWRWITGPDVPQDDPMWLWFVIRVVLLVGLGIVSYAGPHLFRALLARRSAVEASRGTAPDSIFAALAAAMPIVVADETGTIRYATTSMEQLAGAGPDTLEGRTLTTLMPARYRDHHLAGVARFLKTGESRIIGKVIDVDLLRADGTEIPVSLALTASTYEDRPWFTGALWAREVWDQPGVTPEPLTGETAATIDRTATDVEEVKADVKDIRQRMDPP
jgi:PAS domain S-box-containing protein